MTKLFKYSIEDDTLNGVVDEAALLDEINADATVSVDVTYVRAKASDDELTIRMQDDLTGPQETAFNAVVAAHTGEALAQGSVGLEDSEGQSSTTGTTYLTKCEMTPDVMYPGYKYRIGWYCEVNTSYTGTRCQVQIEYDGNVIAETSVEIEDTNDWIPFCGFYYLDADTAVTDITMKYRRQGSSGYSAKIRRARLELTKVDP